MHNIFVFLLNWSSVSLKVQNSKLVMSQVVNVYQMDLHQVQKVQFVSHLEEFCERNSTISKNVTYLTHPK